MELFRYKLTHLVRNEQLVRAKWEIEWQTPDQTLKANAYLYELLGNKVKSRSYTCFLKTETYVIHIS